jgi:hypothetical protein
VHPIIAVNWYGLWNDHGLLRAGVGATIIGAIGSAAYLTALFLGFLGDTARNQFRPRFLVPKGQPALPKLSAPRLFAFVIFGSGVALVFQLAQRDVFAPIQAFVLGATWPTVLSQMISKEASTPADQLTDFLKKLGGTTTT